MQWPICRVGREASYFDPQLSAVHSLLDLIIIIISDAYVNLK